MVDDGRRASPPPWHDDLGHVEAVAASVDERSAEERSAGETQTIPVLNEGKEGREVGGRCKPLHPSVRERLEGSE